MRSWLILALVSVSSVASAAARPITVYMDRDGMAVTTDDGDRVAMPAFGGGDRVWQSTMGCVRDEFAPFRVTITDERPRSGDYVTVLVGGLASMIGMDDSTTNGVSPYTGDVIPNALVYVFSQVGTGERDPANLCRVAAHEVGHALGLDHSYKCGDLMSYFDDECGAPHFLDETVRCGESEERDCGNGEQTQNSYQHIADVVGFKPDAEPRAPVEEEPQATEQNLDDSDDPYAVDETVDDSVTTDSDSDAEAEPVHHCHDHGQDVRRAETRDRRGGWYHREHANGGLVVAVAAVIGSGGCGDDAASSDDTASDDAPTGDGGVDGPPSSCDPSGRFGVPTTMFVLPVVGSGATQSLAYNDIQAAFPAVDWQHLDRLYLPAGVYTQIMLGNLPERTAEHPLVITNVGGQVQIGPAPTANYIWAFSGGSHWILTGRYDADSLTGDAAFPGHACGHYATSAGHYGILSDDAFAFTAPYLHMGITVTDSTDFEIEYVEVKRSGFAGIRLINETDRGVTRAMANVRVHDTYVHDTAGEGYYFGWTGAPPSNLMPGLQIYNNRLIRTGNEALQIQDLGDGSHIHHNAILGGGLHWLDNGLGYYQDNNSQMLVRSGTIEIDHNLFVDGAGTLLNFFSAPEGDDGDRHVTFHDNYFANTLSLGAFLNGTSTAGSSFDFTANAFRGLEFGYLPANATATDPGVIFGRANAMTAPITFTNNRWEGPRKLANGITGGDGTSGPFMATGNLNGPVPELAFPGESAGHHITAWVATITVAGQNRPMTFHEGDVVIYGPAPDLYRATGDATGSDVPGTAAVWEHLPTPDDDVRVDSPDYPNLGVQ